jgi:hypothetical protein
MLMLLNDLHQFWSMTIRRIRLHLICPYLTATTFTKTTKTFKNSSNHLSAHNLLMITTCCVVTAKQNSKNNVWRRNAKHVVVARRQDVTQTPRQQNKVCISTILRYINKRINNNTIDIWIRYNGSSNPRTVRAVLPLKWISRLFSFVGISSYLLKTIK